jgi:superfamily II DNA or RNA helicase
MLDKNLVLEQNGSGWNEKKTYKFKTYYKQKNGDSKWQIPIVKPIEFENNDILPIKPYLLGLALGDGHFTKSSAISIEIHKDDFDELFKDIELTEQKKVKNKRKAYINYHSSDIKKLGLENTKSDTKFIPDIYKYSSIENRLAILRGLMDTDGHCMKSKNGEFNGTEYATTSEQLADDVAEIVHSLGGIVRKKSKVGSYTKKGVKHICKVCYRLNIKMPEGINPFKLKRKSDAYKTPNKYKVGRYIKNIEPYGQEETICIAVDAPDKLYVTEHAIVTHNTASTIMAAVLGGFKKILVVCTASLKTNWKYEISFCDDINDVEIIKNSNFDYNKKWHIVNYDILKNLHNVPPKGVDRSDMPITPLLFNEYDLIILDEAHSVKNSSSNRSKLILDLVKHIKTKWLLTGTPITNRPIDLYTIMKICDSPVSNDWDEYVKYFCGSKQIKTKTGKTIKLTNGSSNLDKLNDFIDDKFLRRRKNGTIDLPLKTRKTIAIDNNSLKEYTEYLKEYKGWVEENEENEKLRYEVWKNDTDKEKGSFISNKPTQVEHLSRLIKIRMLLSQEKVKITTELIKDYIDEGHSIIVFSCFTESLKKIYDEFENIAVYLDGSTPQGNRQDVVNKFQTDKNIKVFCGNIIAAGVGITLTKGDIVIFNDLDWLPSNHAQAEDRCIFGGQYIMTSVGYKKIEDIKVGDLVYTHLGNFKPVTNIYSHIERKKLRVDINAFGYNNNLSVTEDHKLFIYNSENEIFEWVEAINLDIKKHYLTFKSKTPPKKRKQYIKVKNYTNEYFINNHNIKQKNGRLIKLNQKVELTNDLLYAFGFFIAEGWAHDGNNKKSSIVSICQKIDNKKMYDAASYIINIFKKSFGFEKHSEYIDKNNVKTCTLHSKNLAKNFISWFGEGVKNKKLPDWLKYLNTEQLQALLNGFNHGDGYVRKKNQQNITASHQLGSELTKLAADLGFNVSLSIKNIDECKYFQTEYSLEKNNKLNRILIKGGYIVYPIKSLNISKIKRKDERVYDLTVKDDNSFVVGNYNVHNCYRIGQDNEVLVLYPLVMDSLDIDMYNMLLNKTLDINKVFGDSDLNISIKDLLIKL